MHRYHKVTNPGQKISLWDVHYADEIEDWNNRHEKVVTGTPSPNLKHPNSYFNWYYPKYNAFIVFDPRTQQLAINLPQQGNLPLTHPPFTQQHKMNQPIIQILTFPNTKHTLKQHKINHSFKQHKMNRPIIHIKPLTNSQSLTAKHIFHQQPLKTIILSTTNSPTTKTITTQTQIPQHLSHGLISC
jgi:hypothetical protein